MNFRPELAAKVMAGEKTVTRRLTSRNYRSPWFEGGCKLNVGQDYAVCPGRGKVQIGRVRVVDVRLEPLGAMTAQEAVREGFETLEAFYDAFREINGGEADLSVLVWRIAIEACES